MPSRKPKVGRPASVSAFSLSRRLPPLRLPRSSATTPGARPHPQVGRPQPAMAFSTAPPARGPADAALPRPAGCGRCTHDEDDHPVRYVCDKYPHPDPLQICGCESATLEEVCSLCNHKGRWHKTRHRCRADGCSCWAFEQ